MVKLFALMLISVLSLAGCSPLAPANTSTPPPTLAPAVAKTAVPPTPALPTLPPIPTITTAPVTSTPVRSTETAAANCTDKAKFIADVTIPDGTAVASGAPFTKTWRLQNSGTCTWSKEYALVFSGGHLLDAPQTVPLTHEVAPGKTADLSIKMVAPVFAGEYQGGWKLRNSRGATFGVGLNAQTVFTVLIVVGAMPVPSPITGATIRGRVWHDLCKPERPGQAAPSTPPEGCVPSQIGIYRANGILETGEPGIALIKVRLGAGACPSVGLAETSTDSSGRYTFAGLNAGTYCVSVDATSTANIARLSSGRWTFPALDTSTTTVELLSHDTRSDVNFGWDYASLP